LEAINDLNNRLQLWDDDPLSIVKNPKSLVTTYFHPLGYGFRLRIYKLKIKLSTMRMKSSKRRNFSDFSH
jgi:hypothetical protein